MKSKTIAADVTTAFKKNLLPAICLQTLAITLGLLYYFIPAIETALTSLATFKTSLGITYAIGSTSLFGGIFPFTYLFLTKQIKAKAGQQFMFYVAIWAMIGAIVDVFYGFQNLWFGPEASPQIIIKKMMVDQFIFSAFLTCPIITVAYLWKDQLFDLRKTQRLVNRQLFTRIIPTTVITNWLVWIPAVCVIYAMPAPLQIPFFNLVLCFFVLLLAVLNRPRLDNPAG